MHPLEYLSPTAAVLERAQTEPMRFTLEPEGVRVRNERYDDPANHEYLVTVEAGLPIACECPADEKYDGPCKHRVAVGIRTPILSGAAKLAADDRCPNGQPGCPGPDSDELPCFDCYLEAES